ncbi:MAG: signal peptidase II, partial [Pseudomonadota bacterium]
MRQLKLSSKQIRALGLAVFLLLCDQISKWIVIDFFTNHYDQTRLVLTPFLNLVIVYNRGISFGLFHNSPPLIEWLLFILIIAMILVILRWFYRAQTDIERFALAMVLGGAVGNIIDRIFRYGVVDFIDFHLFYWHWPAFNLADSLIVIGAIIIIFN